jgi:hypothetical protein
MVTIKFNSAGGTKVVSYSMTCDKTPEFSVSNDATSWLKIDSVSSTEPKITVSAHTFDTTSTTERTGYVVAKIGNQECDGEKRLQVIQYPPTNP